MKRYAVIARLCVGLMLVVFWGLVDNPLSGVVFALVLAALSVARYRIAPFSILKWLEIVACILYSFFWLPAMLGLWLAGIGYLEDRWNIMEQNLLQKDYEDRAERLKLEAMREIAGKELVNAARLAEMAERSRIAQNIHDHVGHEISGALIALRTAIKLYEIKDERAGGQFRQTAARLELAAEHLRETVHNLKPAQTPGPDSLRSLCDSFTFCPVLFSSGGDLSGFTHWELLCANVKEALTNISRHSNATRVEVRLNGNAKYVRLQVSNDGAAAHTPAPGLGLSGMNERVRAAGGSLSVHTENGFQIVCIIPKNETTEESDEADDR